ncbi:Citron Rho-interacting kinase, partial [Orchesella cincta]
IYFSPPESDNVEPQSKIQRACTMKVETIGEDQKSKFMYMFHKQRHDMRYWIRGIERNKRTGSVMSLNSFNISTSDDEKENQSTRFSEKLLLEDQRPLKIYVNSVYWLAASKVYLLGCDDGLYSLKSIGGKPVRIHGPKAIYQIDVLHAVKYAVFIEGPTRAVTTVYLGLLQSCAEAAECSSPRFNSDVVSKTKDCYILATRSKSSKDTIVAAASKNSLLICGWTTEGLVLVKQEIMKECITALLMTEHSVLFGNQSVLEIDTKTFQVEDFLDMTDESIYYVQIVNESHGSYPVAILDVTKSRGPKADENEYLICFQDIGIFVDSFGRRSRSEDILWSHVPVSFEYRHPYLYIFHFESVEVQLLNEKSYTRESTVTRVASKVGDRTTTQKVAKYHKVLPEVRFHPTASKASPTYVGKGSSQYGVVYFLSAVQSAKMIELSSSFAC